MIKVNYVIVYPSPVVDFNVSDSANCFPLNANFTPLVSIAGGGSVAKYEWGFGDGDSSQVASPLHVYRFNNNFNVTLRVTTDKGCTNFLTKNGYIKVSPVLRLLSTIHLQVHADRLPSLTFSITVPGPEL
jgi:PKD repeat protein